MFQNLTTEGLDESKVDSLGGGRQILESDIYDGAIKQAYTDIYQSGARFIAFSFDLNGVEYRENLLITTKDGVNYYERDGKKRPLTGFTAADHICQAATGNPLSSMVTEPKVIQAWDSDARAMTNQTKEVLVDLIGAPITLAIQKIRRNKQEKTDTGYVDTPEAEELNEIHTVFNTQYKITVREAQNGVEEPTFYHAWLDARKGKTYDRFKEVSGTPGRPPRPTPSGNAPAAPTGGGTSLFGRK